jgi:hypothetical protein
LQQRAHDLDETGPLKQRMRSQMTPTQRPTSLIAQQIVTLLDQQRPTFFVVV